MSSFSITKLACSQLSQTDSHPEIPYSIEKPLTPIFSSLLVHKSKTISLSNSQPNLSWIMWVYIIDEELIDNKINEIEMQQYNSEIKEFYRDTDSPGTHKLTGTDRQTKKGICNILFIAANLDRIGKETFIIVCILTCWAHSRYQKSEYFFNYR